MNIQSLLDNVPVGTTMRFDCPACGGVNTFVATNVDGKTKKYLCFKASCPTKGIQNVGLRDIETLRSLTMKASPPPRRAAPFQIPNHFVDLRSSYIPTEFLSRYEGLHQVIDDDTLPTMVDLHENRLVFFVKDDRGDIVDAIGRWLGPRSAPVLKWKRYASAGIPFLTPETGTPLILVEDCISAALAYNHGYTAGALMGTSLIRDYILFLAKRHDEIIVALDADALRQSVKVQQELAVYVRKVTAKRLQKDLKDMSEYTREATLSCWMDESLQMDKEDY